MRLFVFMLLVVAVSAIIELNPFKTVPTETDPIVEAIQAHRAIINQQLQILLEWRDAVEEWKDESQRTIVTEYEKLKSDKHTPDWQQQLQAVQDWQLAAEEWKDESQRAINKECEKVKLDKSAPKWVTDFYCHGPNK